MAERSVNKQTQEPLYLPALCLCAMHQLLVDIRRTETSIMPTSEGDYALVIRPKGVVRDDRGAGLAIVPYESWLGIGQLLNDPSADGYAEVEIYSEICLGGDSMLAELLLAAVDIGWSKRGFGDTIAAIKCLKSPCFGPLIEFLKPLHPRDLLDELEQRI